MAAPGAPLEETRLCEAHCELCRHAVCSSVPALATRCTAGLGCIVFHAWCLTLLTTPDEVHLAG